MKQFLLIAVTLAFVLTTEANAAKKDGDVQAGKQVKNLQFSWNDCTPKIEGRNQAAAVIKSLQVSPDPMIIPGNISIGFELDSNVNLTSPSPVRV